MGQRLVITVCKDGKDIAAIYYHWSAYTSSALWETQQLLDYLLDDKNSDLDPRLACLRYIQSVGGGIDGGPKNNEFKYIQKLFPNEELKTEGYSRNNGLIALSEYGIKDLHGWSEGDIFIDLDEGEIHNYVLFNFDNLDAYNDFYEFCDDFTPLTEDDSSIFHSDLDLITFYFEDIEKIISLVDTHSLWEYDGKYYTLIE